MSYNPIFDYEDDCDRAEYLRAVDSWLAARRAAADPTDDGLHALEIDDTPTPIRRPTDAELAECASLSLEDWRRLYQLNDGVD